MKEITIFSNSPQKAVLCKNSKHEFSFNNNLFKLSSDQPNTFENISNKRNKKPSSFTSSECENNEDDELNHSSASNFYDIFHSRVIFLLFFIQSNCLSYCLEHELEC